MILLGVLSLKLGRSVVWDGEKEEIAGDPQANTPLRREYREPWKYPAAKTWQCLTLKQEAANRVPLTRMEMTPIFDVRGQRW
jgi:hypothetical protein